MFGNSEISQNILFSPLLSRPQLEAVLRSPLTYIEAPTGCGKTTAVQAFLEHSGMETLWLTLRPGTPEEQWAMVCQGVEQRFAHRLNAARLMMLRGYPYDERRARETAKVIGHMVPETPTVVVLDNFQYFNSFETARLAELVLQHENPDLHLVFLSDNAYRGNGDILRMKGLMTRIDKSCFALTPQEIDDYFAQSGIALERPQVEWLADYTEGWISALLLCLIHRRSTGELPDAAGIYTLMDRLLLQPLSDRERDWLLSLSLLPDFSREMACDLYGGEDCGAYLDRMVAQNLFLTFDDRLQTYSIQQLARTTLSQRFSQLAQCEQAALYRSCASSLERSGQLYEALLYYHAAGAHEQILQVLERDLGNALTPERWPTIKGIYYGCPEEIRLQRVVAMMVLTVSAYCVGDLDCFWALCRELETSLPLVPQTHQGPFRAGLEFLYSLGAFNDIAAMSRHHKNALQLGGSTGTLFESATPTWTLGSPSVFHLFHRESGALEQEITLMRQCMPIYHKLSGGHGAGGEYLFEAESRFLQGNYIEAAAVLELAEHESQAAGQLGNLICGLYLQARLELVRGNYPGCLAVLNRINAIASAAPSNSMLVDMVSLGEAMLYSLIDQPQEVAAWLTAQEAGQGRLMQFAGISYHIIRGRILLLEELYPQVAALYSNLLSRPECRPFMTLQICANLYSATAFHRMGRDSRALSHLTTALDQALPDYLLMPFVENGDELLELLRLLQPQPAYREFVSHILSLHERWSYNKQKISAEFFSGGRSELTPRELQIAELASIGKTNKEIAAELSLAHSTVKKSLAVIYGKLGMNSRKALANYLGTD